MADVDGRILAPFLEACRKYPYHELVAYACGHTIGELRDWLERGAAGGSDIPNLVDFTQRYCKADAEYAAEVFGWIERGCKDGMKGNVGPLWKWFDTRWPCQNPLSISTLLASPAVENLSLDETFGDPDQEIRDALRRQGWWNEMELDNPSAELERALKARGYRRESDARPEPSSLPEG